MKAPMVLCIGLILLAVLISGCTSQPAEPVPTPTPAPVATTVVTATPTPTAAETLVSTEWELGWYDDTKGVWSKIIEGSSITAKFSADGKVRGFSGCSDYITDYQLTDSPGIWFRRPAVPEQVCQTPTGVMNQQSAYYTDLEWSDTYAIENGQLLLYNKDGRKILQFDPAA
jgi:heat shock protein HslJ